jgi:hypothetical protein
MPRDWQNFFTPEDFIRISGFLPDAMARSFWKNLTNGCNAEIRAELALAPRTECDDDPRIEEPTPEYTDEQWDAALVDVRRLR